MAQSPHLRLVPPEGLPGLPAAAPPVEGQSPRRPLGQILLERGEVQPLALLEAVKIREKQDLPLGDVLLAQGWVTETALLAALAEQWGVRSVALAQSPPDPRLIDRLGAATCLREGLLPWRRAGGVTIIVTCRPDAFAAARPQLSALYGPCIMALAQERDIHAALLTTRQTSLARLAEQQLPAQFSCRGAQPAQVARVLMALVGLLALAAALWPVATTLGLTLVAVLVLLCGQGLKLAALLAMRRPPPPAAPLQLAEDLPERLPLISMLVPMFGEEAIADALLERINRIDYPRALLDVLLIVEEEDAATRRQLAAATLPPWMRVVVVPRGPIRTKPRAMNFALNFCRGSIVGIWDAEDSPAPDQLRRVAAGFATAAPDVVCLQGVLDFYNPRTNVMARLFTIEYAVWFRLLLPGLARLGLVVPLGGTTLFLRRAALEELGGWDAHNVTEDADLGLRIARRGWRTEMLDSVTEEEANCRTLPWIRQRSRWQKGFAMTWGTHMRRPLRLLSELGWWRFLGVQVLLAGSLLQALMAPTLWGFWALSLGGMHPVAALLPPGGVALLIGLFLAGEAVNLLCGLQAMRLRGSAWLMPWVPALHLYNMLATASVWKALHEVITRPFYWDKTRHGVFGRTDPTPGTDPAALPPLPPRLRRPA